MRVFLLLASSLFGATLPDQPPPEIARTIAAAYEANCARITRGSAKITYSVGMADDLEAALADRWSDRTDAAGEFALDMPRARYDQIFDPKDLVAKRTMKGNGSYSTRLISGRVVTDGRVTLTEEITMRSGPTGDVPMSRLTITRGTTDFSMMSGLPLNLGVVTPDGSPGWVIRNAIDGHNGWRIASVDLDALLDGVRVAEVTVEAGATGRGRFWFDLKRGAVPIQVRNESSDGKQFDVERCDDLRELPDGAWVPLRRTSFSHQKLVQRVMLRDADFSRAPGADTFRFNLTTATPVFDHVAMTRYGPRNSWDLARLPGAGSPGNSPMLDPSQLVVPPVLPGERRAWSTSSLVFLGVGLTLVLVSVSSIWRRRHA